MSPITVTADAYQTQIVILADGSSYRLTIRFRQSQTGWFIDELLYKTFVLRGVRITNSPNVLHQFCNQIPFGIACISDGMREPQLQTDFSTSASKLYTLSEAEVADYVSILRNG